MNRRQKLTLAKLCYTHSAEYKLGNRGKFWHKMSELLKQQTGYDHRGVQTVVERWIKIRQTELFEQEMESGTEVERNPFMEAIDKFSERWQQSHNRASGKATCEKTREEESSNNVSQAHHIIMTGNSPEVGIIRVGGSDTSQEEEEDNDDDDDDKDTTLAPTSKRAKHRAAENSISESFSRIADCLISESQKWGGSEEQGGSQGERWRKRRRSNSTEDEKWARIEAKFDAKMDQFIARISKKLDDFAANRPQG